MIVRRFKYILPLILALALLGIIVSGCGNSSPTTPVSSTSPTVTPTVTPTITPINNPTELQATAVKLGEAFIKNSSTFKFDGKEGSIKFIEMKPSPISAYQSGIFVYEYQTGHPGHGDRTGQILAQVITNHNAEITINLEKETIVSATCDNTWDMLNEKDQPVTIHGVVISGGDTTPADGPLDTPRKFVYKVLTEEGYFVYISYTAYPPSPAGDVARAKITLDFYNGQMGVGDQITVRGTLDKQSNTIIVADQGDSINTTLHKVTVLGAVVSVIHDYNKTGQTVFELIRDDGTFVNVSFKVIEETATQSLYNEPIRVGDYMKAVGTYDRGTNTVIVSTKDDMIKTYDHRAKLGE